MILRVGRMMADVLQFYITVLDARPCQRFGSHPGTGCTVFLIIKGLEDGVS
jgi:hypothetical protein